MKNIEKKIIDLDIIKEEIISEIDIRISEKATYRGAPDCWQ